MRGEVAAAALARCPAGRGRSPISRQRTHAASAIGSRVPARRGLLGGPVQQQVAEGEEEVGRRLAVGQAPLGVDHRLGMPADLLQRVEQARREVGLPRAGLWPQRVGLRQRGSRGRELAVGGVVLAELVSEMGVVRRGRDLGFEQPSIAAALGRQPLGGVAVVADHHRQPPHRQRMAGLLVDAAGIADRAGQDPAQPVVDHAGGGPLVVQAQRADEVGCLCLQRLQCRAALDQPLVRIEHQVPVGAGDGQCGVARGGEVVTPGEVSTRAPQARACAAVSSREPVSSTSISSTQGAMRAQQTADAGRLVAGDHNQSEAHDAAGGVGSYKHADRIGGSRHVEAVTADRAYRWLLMLVCAVRTEHWNWRPRVAHFDASTDAPRRTLSA